MERKNEKMQKKKSLNTFSFNFRNRDNLSIINKPKDKHTYDERNDENNFHPQKKTQTNIKI